MNAFGIKYEAMKKTRRLTWKNRKPAWMASTFLLIAIVNLIFLFWSGWDSARSPYDGIKLSPTDQVESIDSDGPAARAGIRLGDTIIAINGMSIKEMTSPYEGLHAGDQSVYSVIRDSQLIIVTVNLESLPVRSLIATEEPIFVGFIFWATSLFIWLVTPDTRVSQIFFLLGQAATLMFATGTISTFRRNSVENYIFTVSVLLLSAFIAHFYVTFPVQRRKLYRRIFLACIYGAAALLIVSHTLATYTDAQYQWIRFLNSQKLTFITIGLVAALLSLFAPQTGASIHSRRQKRLLVAGMLISVLPVLLLSFLPQRLAQKPLLSYFWTFPFLIILPLSYAYAARVENLDRFDYLLKRIISTFILGGIFSAIYFIIFGVLHSASFPTRWCHITAGSLMLLLIVASITPLKRRIDLGLDHFFYGHWYDYRSIIQQNSRHLSGMIRFEELAHDLLQNVRTMRFKEAILFRKEGDRLRPYRYFGYPSQIIKDVVLSENDVTIQRLMRIGKPCESTILVRDGQNLSPAEQKLLKDAHIQIWLPLLTAKNELLGVMTLGQRQSNERLDKDDWAILDTLTDQTSLAAENIHLVETLRKQLQSLERMQKELKEAKWRLADNRERERLELAQLLHDGPIQDIYGVLYQLAIWRKLHEAKDDPALDAIENDLKSIEQHLRFFSTELRPPTLETFGLERAVRSHISKLRETNPEIEILPDLTPLGDVATREMDLALFRIYQEAVRNAIRHARPSKIWVRLFKDDKRIILEIEDNGQGFEPPKSWMDFARQGHLGILGITERVEAIGGNLEVKASIGAGALLRVTVPIKTSVQRKRPK